MAVQCAGALATVFGLCIAGITWGLPQALITAELAAALPSNGGPVHWVTRAFGRRWGFINGLLLILQVRQREMLRTRRVGDGRVHLTWHPHPCFAASDGHLRVPNTHSVVRW